MYNEFAKMNLIRLTLPPGLADALAPPRPTIIITPTTTPLCPSASLAPLLLKAEPAALRGLLTRLGRRRGRRAAGALLGHGAQAVAEVVRARLPRRDVLHARASDPNLLFTRTDGSDALCGVRLVSVEVVDVEVFAPAREAGVVLAPVYRRVPRPQAAAAPARDRGVEVGLAARTLLPLRGGLRRGLGRWKRVPRERERSNRGCCARPRYDRC